MLNQKQYRIKNPYLRLFKGCVLIVLICLPVMATLSDYGITFDEPIYMEAAWNINKWLSLGWSEIFNPEEINRYWKTDPGRNVHPSAVKWLYLAAQKIIFWENDPYIQNRVLSILIFGISLLVFLHWWEGGSLWRGAAFILLLLSIPRFFAHVHFSATDIPMTSFLMLFVVCLDRTLLHRAFWSTGIILGLFVSIKITSVLLVLPLLLVFILWHRDKWRIVIPRIAMICLIGILVFYIINPDWWFSPLSRCKEYLIQSLTRRSWSPFTLYFGGHFYDYRGPFSYPLIIFLITTPILHILLLVFGITYFFSKRSLCVNFKMILLFTCLVFPFLLLALPMSPAHDGVRYLLPAFPFAAVFMTIGLRKLWGFLSERSSHSHIKVATQWMIAAATLGLFAVDLYNPARYPPYELSYYNKIVGGLSGAHRIGYDTTYWWEILNDDVLEHLNNLCAGSTVYFPVTPTDLYFRHMLNDRRIKFLPVRDPKKAKFMLILGRPFVRFWESQTEPIYRQEGKFAYPIWNISLDSVPLLQLYLIKKVDNKN